MHEKNNNMIRPLARLAAIAVVGAFLAVPAVAQQPLSELDEGMIYVEGLQARGFLDIADLVLKDLSTKYPEARTRAAALQLKGELLRGKFDDVKARIAAAEKSGAKEDILWAMKLALAEAYFTYAKYDECSGIYGSFFSKYQGKDKSGKTISTAPESLKKMYDDAAYKYTQMLLSMKRREQAANMYQVMLDTCQLPQHIARQCMAEMAEIKLSLAEEAKDAKAQKPLLDDVNKVCDKLLWVQDLWFGKAIVLKAHVLMIQNNPAGAQKLVDTYMGTLTQIHQALVEQEQETGEQLTRVSPMAECRYLLAVMLQEKAKQMMDAEGFSANDPKQREAVLSLLLGNKDVNTGKRKGDGAFNHFVNVYLRYPESNWAADAGEHSDQVREWLVNVFGGNVKTVVSPEQTARVRTIQYRDARALVAQGQIDEAKSRLAQVLNSFPDCPDAIPALGDLARCYMRDTHKDENAILYAQTVIGHLAERFRDSRESMITAGDELIRVAEHWGEYGRDDLRLDTYSLFFRLYPKHPSCVSYLASFGEKAYQDKDYPHALEFYSIVAESYTNSPRAYDALSRIASIHEETGDYASLIPVLDDFIARLKTEPKPLQMLYSTRFRKAGALRTLGLETIRSDTTNAAEKAAAVRNLSLAISEFDKLAAELKSPPPSAEIDAREKAQNTKIREVSLFNKAVSLTQLPITDPARLAKMREVAIATYEELIADYPKGDSAPAALIQIGSIYAMLKDAAKAEAALSRLRKDYPNSEQAKSALPLIADNLMKLGMREEAIARYREMFSGNGAEYSKFDLLRAANALIDAKEFEMARVAVDKVIALTADDPGVAVQARFADCRLLVASKNFGAAVDKLRKFIADFPNVVLVIDANLLLSQAASEAGLVEKDSEHRFDLFNYSLDAMKEVKKRRTNDLEVAQCDLETGRIMARKAKAEKEFGDAAKAADYRGKALISYQGIIDSGSADPRRTAIVETAYLESIPLLIDHGLWDVVSDNCGEYLSRFPKGRYAAQFNAWKQQAAVELGNTGAAPAPAPAEKTEETE